MRPIIDRLVNKGKLIFAAASNSGTNGKRAYPAKQEGVFAIHALTEDGRSPGNMNPPPDKILDNFATLGYRIPSRWKGSDKLISGTSFSTSIAVAIAANLLEFIRQAPHVHAANPHYFFSYNGMRHLLSRISGLSASSNYQYIRPWMDGMFTKENGADKMQQELGRMPVFGYR